MRTRAGLLLAILTTGAPVPAPAQVRASERAGAWQTVDGTTIRVEFGRPATRGRTLFGGLIHWGEVWTPGANWATTLEVDRDIRINDVAVPAGRYSVWVVPAQDDAWTFNLDARDRRFHTQRPDAAGFAVRIPVTPATGAHTERLTFDFEDFTRGGTTLRMRWGTVVLPLDIRVRATLARPMLTPETMAPYLGHYTVDIYGEGPEPQPFPLELYAADGRIRGRDGGEAFIELIPTDEPHRFHIAMMRGGEIFDVEETILTFDIEAGRATGFVVPGTGIPVWMEAKRAR